MPFEKKGTLKLRCGGINLRIRQNSDLVRLMNFKKPISYGVVFLSLFGNNILNRYPCAYIMKALTGQYNQLYTYKFRVFFLDFKPSTTNNNIIDLVNLPKAVQVVSLGWRLNTAFVGVSLSNVTLRLFQDGQVPSSGVSTGQFGAYGALGAVSDINGRYDSVLNRARVSPSNGQTIWSSYLSPTLLKIRIELNAASVINNLSAGAVDIWVVTMKMP